MPIARPGTASCFQHEKGCLSWNFLGTGDHPRPPGIALNVEPDLDHASI